MGTETLACPSCGSGVAEPYVETGDVLSCPYCESRYRVVNHRAVAVVPGPEPEGARQLLPALLAVGLILLLSAAAAAWMRAGERDAGVVRAPFEAAPEGASSVAEAPARTAPAEASQAAPEQAVPSAEWRLGSVMDSPQGLYILGHVENTSELTLDQAKIVVVLLDEEGNEVAVDTGFSERRQLAPGEVSPVRLFLKDPPAHAERRVVLELKTARHLLPQVEGLRVEPLDPVYDASWGWSFQGKVLHEGTVPARFVKVEVQALDAAGGLLGLTHTYGGGDLMEPGSSFHFSTTHLRTPSVPASFAYSVSGRP